MHETHHGSRTASGSGARQHTPAQPALTRFALDVYGAEGVSAACLFLQARTDLDVNLLLFAAFVGARGETLTPARLGEAGERVDAWHAEVVQPLRAVRQRLKSGPSPAPDERTAALRSAIQKLEIEAELIELAELGTLDDARASTLETERQPGGAEARDAAAAAMNVVVHTQAGRHPHPDERDAIALIAAAAAAFENDTTQVNT